MKTSSPIHAALAAVTALIVVGFGSATAIPIVRGFVSQSPRSFEYNSGFLKSGDYVSAAFTVFGAYPGLFDVISIEYSPEMPWENDCEVVVGSFNLNSYYWSGDNISGSGQFFDFGTHPLLSVIATFQNAVLNTGIENVNVRGYYSGSIENEDQSSGDVADSGSTLVLLSGSLVLGLVAWSSRRRTC